MDVYKTTFSGYQRLLDDPFSEPVSGVPNEFGERTRKIRVRVREMVVADANDVKFKCMPHAGVANDVDVVRIEGGHVLGTANSHLRTSSDYQNSDFGDTLRGRLVSARLRVTPTDATSNGTLYACSDPGRDDISGLTNEEIERRFSTGNMAVGRASEETMVVHYRPTLDEEVEGWTIDATKGPYDFSREITATEYPCSHMITWSGNNAAGDVEVPSGVTNTAYAQGSPYNLYQEGTSQNVYATPGNNDAVLKDSMAFDGNFGEVDFNTLNYDWYSAGWRITLAQKWSSTQAKWKRAPNPMNDSGWAGSNWKEIYRTNPGETNHAWSFCAHDETITENHIPTNANEPWWPWLGEVTATKTDTSGLFFSPAAGDITIQYGSGFRPRRYQWYIRRMQAGSGGWSAIGSQGYTSGGWATIACPDMRVYGAQSYIALSCTDFTGNANPFEVSVQSCKLRRVPGPKFDRDETHLSTGGSMGTDVHSSGTTTTVTTQGQAVTGVNQGSEITYAAEAQTEARPQRFWVEYDAVYELSGDEVVTDATPNPMRGGEPIVAYYDACSAVRKVGAGKRDFDELARGDKMS